MQQTYIQLNKKNTTIYSAHMTFTDTWIFFFIYLVQFNVHPSKAFQQMYRQLLKQKKRLNKSVFFKYSKMQMNPIYLRKIIKWPQVARNQTIRTLSAVWVCASVLTCLNMVVRLLVLPCSNNSRYRIHQSLGCWACMHAQEAQ